MVFLSVCVALYQYVPRDEGELAIEEGELVYILEKSTEDDWWKATKKASGGEKDDPIGLIPQTYVEEAQPTHHAKALYDYTRQTDEELSFSEDAALTVYDTADPDWTLVGLNGEYGFVPTNYIELTGEIGSPSAPSEHAPQAVASGQPMTPDSPVDSPAESPQSPAAALAGVMRARAPPASQTRQEAPPPQPARPQYTPQASDEDSDTPAPSLPQRRETLPSSPPSQPVQPRNIPSPPGVIESPPYLRSPNIGNQSPSSPGGFHLYNINEMVSALGKKKKLPTTLGINLATGNIMIAPEKSRDGPQQEWTAEKLTNYSIEGKHVFIDLVKPSKSIHFHAGAKDTAMEIVSALGELAGAARAEGLREVIAAGTGAGAGQRKGQVLYDFMAQGDDEVTVAVGDDVVILDDTKSEEWWMVRRLKNGKEGVVPSSYVEVAPGISSPTMPSFSGINAGRSTVEQNRMEEERLAKDAVKASKRSSKSDRGAEVGPGVRLPKRGSSLSGPQDSNVLSSQRNKRENRSEAKGTAKPKPDTSKVRVWTDRSGSFKVEAQFIGLKDGKIHLHKLNGVKIAVPVSKMAVEDLEYVELQTGQSLDEDKPISSIMGKNKKLPAIKDHDAPPGAKVVRSESAGAEVSSKPQPKPPEYDWFDFFLKCGVNPYQCERYAFNFNKDSMDEDVLPEITAPLLRNLGLKEGDVLRVMKFLDVKFNRKGNKSKLGNVTNAEGEDEGDGEDTPSSGGLFSGPGGTLKNNTRKGRPAPAVQTNDTVDPKAFQQKNERDNKPAMEKALSPPLPSGPAAVKRDNILDGFDDDAWDVKPSKQANGPASTANNAASPPQQTPAAPPKPQLSAGQAELSLLSTPLQPIIAHSTGAPPSSQNQQQPQQPLSSNPQQPLQNQPQPQQPLQQQPTGATPGFFAGLNQQNFTGQPQQNIHQQQGQQPQYISPQQTGFGQPQQQYNQPRQRPQPPSFIQSSGVLPPPPRPLSAPQNSQSNFGPPAPLAPQLTGALPQNFGQIQNQPQQPTLNDLSRLTLQNQQYNQQQQQFQQQQQQQQLQPQPTGFPQQSQNFAQFSNFGQQPPRQFGQQQQLGPQPTGFQPQPTGFQPQPTGFQPHQATGFNQSQLFQNGQQSQNSPFADPRPGFQSQFGGLSSPPPIPPQRTGINAFLPPALNPQPTGINGFNRPAFGQPQPGPGRPQAGFDQAAAAAASTPPPIPQQQQQPTLAPLRPQKTGPAPPVSFGRQPEAKKLVPQPTGRRANLSQATPDNPFGF